MLGAKGGGTKVRPHLDLVILVEVQSTFCVNLIVKFFKGTSKATVRKGTGAATLDSLQEHVPSSRSGPSKPPTKGPRPRPVSL